MHKRSTPDVGYITPEAFAGMGMSQLVRAKDTVYVSGLVSATGMFELLHEGDAAGQVTFVIDMLEKQLATEGMTLANVVSTVIYTPDLDALIPAMGIFGERFGAHPPCMSMIGVARLGVPGHLLELTAVAVD